MHIISVKLGNGGSQFASRGTLLISTEPPAGARGHRHSESVTSGLIGN
jgi:hypothetical protein